LGVAHQFEDVRSTLDLQPFRDAPAFRTYGAALDRTAYIARASLSGHSEIMLPWRSAMAAN
jgi:hypothetical protein